MNFAQSTLYISARSPFARRVRIALQEHGVSYEEKVFDVFKPAPELIALNPLARVPVLRLADGTVFVESEKMLNAFYATQPKSPLLPKNAADKVTCEFWSAMALGMFEKSIEFYLESLRPEANRDAELLVEIRDIATRVLERFEHFIADRDTIIPGQLTQADIDMGSALAYFSLRYSPQWADRYTHQSEFLQRLDARPSFQATRPPAAI